MRVDVIIAAKDNPEDNWVETFETSDEVENPEAWAQSIVDKFNSDLRKGERPRILLEVVGIDWDWREHDWHKTNLVTIMEGRTASYDTYQCQVCGITGKRYGLDRNIVRDRAFKAAVYSYCHTALTHMAQLRERQGRE